MARSLTEKQQKFLEVLFDEANGDVVQAKKLAGYGENSSTSVIVESLKDEIGEKTRTWFARTAPKAAMAMTQALYDPTELGIRDKMAAAKDLLDRAGLGKVDKVDVTSGGGGIFYLPPKEGKNEQTLPQIDYKRDLGFWELPKPKKGKEKEWHTVAKVSQTIPFGYEVDPDNDKLLLPIPYELEALELAKRHLNQYSYREVAIWLTKHTDRCISHMGLKRRVEIDRRRKKAAIIKRRLAKRLQETLAEIEKLEKGRVGAYSEES